ncbi:MAG: ImmA/IrrE family metallo-endopeptidase [Ruminococcus sp.]|jgi:Zn-dependent peptidase ImmA (M78 family)|nr:ImmA/IrrE family metallo-endopeptidase [Ruminococcus sp.]
MLFEQISKKAQSIKARCKTCDPYKIAEQLNIKVRFAEDFVRLKGMYTVVARNRFIILSRSLDEQTARIVLAHEIGHDRLHFDLAKQTGFSDITLYDMNTRPEYEANIFAAELLLDTDEVLELIYDGRDALETAKILGSDVNLVALKVASLTKQGYQFRLQDYRSDFLK